MGHYQRNSHPAPVTATFSGGRRLPERCEPTLPIVTYGDGVWEDAQQIFTTYGQDHRLSFCDAISFIVVTTLLDHAPCFTFDGDFRSLGLTVFP
jgi:predicted nucleic acid-binding protein